MTFVVHLLEGLASIVSMTVAAEAADMVVAVTMIVTGVLLATTTASAAPMAVATIMDPEGSTAMRLLVVTIAIAAAEMIAVVEAGTTIERVAAPATPPLMANRHPRGMCESRTEVESMTTDLMIGTLVDNCG